MIPADADRDAVRALLMQMPMGAYGDPTEITAAILDADDLLVTNLTCPTCGGEGVEFLGDDDDIGDACSTCHGTGRRDVVVVDAAEWERCWNVAPPAPELDEAWRLLVRLLRASNYLRLMRVNREAPYYINEAHRLEREARDACLANPVLAAEVER
jgi:hypothetical protein